MKKILLATTMLAASASVAAADVTISGLGRFGLKFAENDTAGLSETTIGGRLRLNIDASTETDTGVVFGGRVRLQYDIGHGARGQTTTPAPGLLYVSYEGLRVEVGNANTAIDSSGLYFASEIGFDFGNSGNGIGNFFFYDSSPYNREYVGVFSSYSFGDFTGRISYIQPDQFFGLEGEDELSVGFDYASGPLALSFAAVWDGAGEEGADSYFVGAAYDFTPELTAGLLYYDEETGGENYKTTTVYGHYGYGATTFKGFVAFSDDRGTEDFRIGVGADYDLGGAILAGSIGQNFNSDTVADFGVRFSF